MIAKGCTLPATQFMPTAIGSCIICRHVTNAQSVPLEQVNASIADKWRSKTLVVTGSDDTRSQQVCTRLSKVYNLKSVFHLIKDAA